MALPALDVLSVCAGYGGLDLALRLATGGRARTVAYVEREAAAVGVLAARMADGGLDDAPVWDDLGTFDGRPWRGVVDLVAGGIPCQPFSVAGKRGGLADERWLWPAMRRVVGECGAPLLLVENVPGFARSGLAAVLADLAEDGWDAEWGLFSAAGVGLPHKRERLFLLAHRDGAGLGGVAERDRDPIGAGPLHVGDDPDGRDHPLAHARRGGDDAGQPLAVGGGGDAAGVGAAGSVVADPDGGGRGAIERRDGPGQPDAAGSGRRDGAEPVGGRDVADADRERRAQRRGALAGGAEQPSAQRSGGDVAITDRDGRAPDGGRAAGDGGEGAVAPWPGHPSLPGPGDRDGWVALLATAPWLAPAVEPEFRRVSHGSPTSLDAAVDAMRTDPGIFARIERRARLRMLGNGVVPATGALAVRVLWDRLMGGTA